MAKKVIAGAAIALVAGIAAFIYRRNKSKIDEAAAEAYNGLSDTVHIGEDRLENAFS